MTSYLLAMFLLQASGPFARARVEPAEPVTVGQPVSVVVEVLVPSYFMGAPRFPDIDVPGGLVLFEPRGTNFTERVGTETFAGQSRRYTIYPQRAGSYEIREIPVAVRYFSGSGPADGKVSPPTVRFTARVPAAAEGLGYFIATSHLTIEDQLSPETHELKVGEALERTLTITVSDALSMVIPPVAPVAFGPIPGLGVYPRPPNVNDAGGERGEAIVGTRVEGVSYVAEKEGSYRLPGVELIWWDVNAERLRSATAPAVDIQVVANPNLTAELALPADELEEEAEEVVSRRIGLGEWLGRLGISLGVIVLLVLAFHRFRRKQTPRRQAAESEETLFRRFRDAASSGDVAAAARTFMFWLDRRHARPGPALFRDFAEEAADPALEREAQAVDEILYAVSSGHASQVSQTSWSGDELFRRVAAARKKRALEEGSGDELPPLNP